MALAAEQGFPFYQAMGTILWGWVAADQGQVKQEIERIHEGIATLQAMGARLWQPLALSQLAEAYRKIGQSEEGLTMLAEALAMVHQNEGRFYEAELYRLKGELTLAQSKVQSLKSEVTDPRPLIPDPQAEAEACFQKAIEIARRQQAKSLELRATMSLSRLWQQQGKQEEAHKLLSDIYGWFTEGLDTKDLQEAKALLAELAERR